MPRSIDSIKRRKAYHKRWKDDHRAQQKAATGRGQKSYTKTRFQSGKFIAFDGEGKAVGERVTLPTGHKEHPDTVSHHVYDQVQFYYDGNTFELSNFGQRLTTFQILDKCLEVAKACPDAVAMVGFGLSYDYTHILHDLTQEQLKELYACSQTRGVNRRCFKLYNSNRQLYLLEYRERKYLSCRFFADGKFLDPDTKTIRKPDARFCLWDAFGFFQGNFIKTIEEWLGADHPELPLIRRMKKLRGQFDQVPDADIRRYNQAEVECLAEIMHRLWKALTHTDVNLVIKRWDGAGAVAAAVFEKYKIKKHLQNTQVEAPEVFRAARYAFSGGHIESGFIGYETLPIAHGDINSAYPYAMCQLPSLAEGTWQHGFEGEPPKGFTLVRIDFRFTKGRPFYPLFWRGKDGAIMYPRCGSNWYWFPEYEVAKGFVDLYGAHEFIVSEWFHWIPKHPNLRPFAEFVRPMYDRRATLKASQDEQDRAAQIVLKLGLNSLYGKLCQQLGAEVSEDGSLIKGPPYFQLEYAGFITSFTRAKLFREALPILNDVILFATDAIFSRQRWEVDKGRQLGQWDEVAHDGMGIVQPGVYIYWNGDKQTAMTRGYEKEGAAEEYKYIRQAWREQKSVFIIEPRSQMITMKQALKSPALWPYRGCFRLQVRQINLDGYGAKRQAVDLAKNHPADRLVRTKPHELNHPEESTPFRLGWKALERASEEGPHLPDVENDDVD